MQHEQRGGMGWILVAFLVLVGLRQPAAPTPGAPIPGTPLGLEPEVSGFDLTVTGTHGGSLPHPKNPGESWGFNATFSYRGRAGNLVVYAGVGRGGTLFPFNVEGTWKTSQFNLPVPVTSVFAEMRATAQATVPAVPEGTYDAEAEVWYFPTTFVPISLDGARASSDGIFLARDNDQCVYKVVSGPVLSSLNAVFT